MKIVTIHNHYYLRYDKRFIVISYHKTEVRTNILNTNISEMWISSELHLDTAVFVKAKHNGIWQIFKFQAVW